MPAKSKKQQKFFGLILAIKRGKAKGSPQARKAAMSISEKSAEEFAETKRKGLPERSSKKSVKKAIRRTHRR